MECKDLNNQIIGLYFSAHWCGPCRTFTPQLAKVYNQLKEQGKKLEIVFISSDQDDDSFRAYHSEMPWLAIPFDDKKHISHLKETFQVNSIPTLILFDETGKMVTRAGRELIAQQGAEGYPYRPDPAEETKKKEAFTQDLRAIFQYLDENKDEKVTLEEVVAGMKRGKVVPVSQIEKSAQQMLNDVNGGSAFTVSDWVSYFQDLTVINEGLWSLAFLRRMLGFVSK